MMNAIADSSHFSAIAVARQFAGISFRRAIRLEPRGIPHFPHPDLSGVRPIDYPNGRPLTRYRTFGPE